MIKKLLFLSISLAISVNADAYEIGTHAYVTKLAVDASVLSPAHPKSIVPVTGFDRLDAITPLAALRPDTGTEHRYYDNAPLSMIDLGSAAASNFTERSPQELEGKIFEALRVAGRLTGIAARADFEFRVEAWVMRGAIREDDNDAGLYAVGGSERDRDPWNSVFRAGRHFYDPINNRSLANGVSCFLFGCKPAVEWAMGRTGVLGGSPPLDTARENHFSWQDARDNYWWALTYKPIAPASPTLGVWQQRYSGNRNLRWATTLKAVGQVIHLLQDMAQPQHARNDSHGPPTAQIAIGDNPADGAFEAYTEARLLRTPIVHGFSNPITQFSGAYITIDQVPPLRLPASLPYPTPSFGSPIKFFTTRQIENDPSARRGLADLSNRGFFTSTSLPINVGSGQPDPSASAFLDPPRPSVQPGFYTEQTYDTTLYADGTAVRLAQVLATVPDVLAPTWNAQSGLFAGYGNAGKLPLLNLSQKRNAADLIAIPTPETQDAQYDMSYPVLESMADAMLPRAVAYSTGLIDYFFRGRLEVTPRAQNVFAVMNQGEAHTVDAEGYPRKNNGDIFGFEKVRLRVRNISEAITESGPAAAAIAQASGNGKLVAVARYHRNACYKRDMSGERTIGYAPPPSIGAITEPSCAGMSTRTEYQEISVSAPLTIASAADLPGGQGSGGPAAIDKVFDFSADPIPVNASDLFVQVVYRGQLGDEPDGIAVGTYDVREPTFIGIFNNTDYYWHSSQARWILHTTTTLYPWQNVDYLRVCTGASVDSRWAYYAEPLAGAPAMGIPSFDPGFVRLAMIFAKPNPPAQQFSVRVTPVMNVTSAAQRSYSTRGQQHQANKERIDASVLNSPMICTETAPTVAAYWCNTPIKKRRGQLFGEVAAPIYYDNTFGTAGNDVDAAPALPTFPDIRLTDRGTIKYNDATLATCPPAPTQSPAAQELIELLEMAADQGIGGI